MNQSSASFSNLILIGSLYLLSLTASLSYISFWKPIKYQLGDSSGSYWFLVYYEEIIVGLALINLVFFCISLFFWVMSKRKKWKINLAIFVSVIALTISCINSLPAFNGYFEHLDTLVVKNQRYHLAILSGTEMPDVHYYLFRCDRFDMNCRSIYRCGLADKVKKATLMYDRSSDQVKIQDGGKEIDDHSGLSCSGG